MNEEDNQLQEQEQNSIGKEIANQAIQQGKNAAKNAAKNKAKAVLVKLMPIIIKIVVIVLIVILFIGGIYVVKDKISEIGDSIGDAIVKICKIGDNGPVIPGMLDVIDQINEELEENGINKENIGLGNNIEADIYLYKYMATALSTELPYIKDSKAEILKRIVEAYITKGISEIINEATEIQGIIHIKRTETDIASARDLKFIKYDKFTKKIENSDGDTKDYFSIDDDWNLCVAKSYKVTVNGAVTQYTLEEVKIPYRTLVAQYTMPFKFLIDLQQITDNAEYVSAVADLINDDGEIEFMILDCMETTTEIYTYNHSIKSKTLVEKEVTTNTNPGGTGSSANGGSTTIPSNLTKPGTTGGSTTTIPSGLTKPNVSTTNRGNKDTLRIATSTNSQLTRPTITKVQEIETSGPTEQPEQKTTTVIEENTIKANVTKANVWVINQTTTYNLQETETEPMGPNGITTYIDDEQEPEDPTTVGQTVSWKVDQKENTYQKVNTKDWQVVETNTKIDADKFLGLWRNNTGIYVEGASYKSERQGGILVKYPLPLTYKSKEDAESEEKSKHTPVVNIYSAEQMLYNLLEKSESTQTHATLMRYLIKLYKTGEPLDQANVEFDLDLSIYNPTEFNESTFIVGIGGALEEFLKAWEGTVTDANGNYKVFNDGYGNATVGYGICIKYQKGRLNSRGLTELTTYNRESDLFGKVLVGRNDLIDDVKREIINEYRQDIIKQTMGLNLSETQIDALVAIKFQYGNIGNFVAQYKRYGNTDALRNAVCTNGGKYYFRDGIPQARAEANWKLFHEGIYTDKSGNIIQSSTGSANIDISNLTGNAKTVVSRALEQVDKMYVWGGETPEVGFDCSGLVMWSYAQIGIQLPHSADGIAGRLSGKEIPLSVNSLKPGDILWKSGHIAIYIGNDTFVHAPGRGKQITTANFTDRQKGQYAFTKAFRIIP